MGKPTTWMRKTRFWTEPRHCMVLGLKPMGKPTTWTKKLDFGQNQGIAWSSDLSLWENQLLGRENWVLDRTKALYGPRIQTNGETNYLDEKKIEFRKVGYLIKILSYSKIDIYMLNSYPNFVVDQNSYTNEINFL